MARLIRTETEVEGRFEEVWLVVDEDELAQWPAGERDTVGRPAIRASTAPGRARGEALFTGDIRLPGMIHAAVLRSPHARADVKRLDLSRRASRRRVFAARSALDDCPPLTGECQYEGAPVAALAADTFDQARAAST